MQWAQSGHKPVTSQSQTPALLFFKTSLAGVVFGLIYLYHLQLLQVLRHLPLDLLQTEDVGLGVREGRVQDIDVGPVLLDTGMYTLLKNAQEKRMFKAENRFKNLTKSPTWIVSR